MSSIMGLFGWLPGPLRVLFVGAIAIFILVALFKIVWAIIKTITDLIPGW